MLIFCLLCYSQILKKIAYYALRACILCLKSHQLIFSKNMSQYNYSVHTTLTFLVIVL